MVVVTALYPNEPGSSFDYEYYLNKHVPLVRERWRPLGLENQRQVRGMGTLDGSPAPYQVIAFLTFRSLEDFQNAAQAHGQEILDDIAKFTSVQALVQISEELT